MDTQPGRPKTMRTRAEYEPIRSRNRKCKKCDQAGHNIGTCNRRNSRSWQRRNKGNVGQRKGKAKGNATANTSTGTTTLANTSIAATTPANTSAVASVRNNKKGRKGLLSTALPTSMKAPTSSKVSTRKSKRLANTQYADLVTKNKLSNSKSLLSQP